MARPQYMIAGEAAGVAGAMAATNGRAVHDVDIVGMQARLRRRGAIISRPEGQETVLG
jgi:hypothetical protein